MDKVQTALTYVKKYWAVALLVVGTIVGLLLFRQRDASFADKLKKIQDAHDEEIKRIQEARDQEEKQHQVNLKQLQDTLDLVQQRYDEAKQELDDKKRAQVEDIVKKYSDNPDELAKQLSEATGFAIVLPG